MTNDSIDSRPLFGFRFRDYPGGRCIRRGGGLLGFGTGSTSVGAFHRHPRRCVARRIIHPVTTRITNIKTGRGAEIVETRITVETSSTMTKSDGTAT